MPFYGDIQHPERPEAESKRIAERILALKQGFKEQNIPTKTLDKLLLATWNIREFDSASFGLRLDESIYYIAEIINRFDLVAVQEIRDDLSGLRRVMELLGPNYKVLFTDVTEGTQGNKERTAFIYDTRKVELGGLAGELVIPSSRTASLPQKQLARTPYIVGFKVGWYRFMIVTVHLIYGEGKANADKRVEEARLVSQFLAERAEDPNSWSDTIVLLGDFNIFNPSSETFEAIAENFRIPEAITSLPSNIAQSKHFDQIAFRSPLLGDLFSFRKPVKAGIFNFFDYVFKSEDEAIYTPYIGDRYLQNSNGELRDDKGKSQYFNTYWRTHQMSDHFPLWVELPIDRSVQYLQELSEEFESKSWGKKVNFSPKQDDF